MLYVVQMMSTVVSKKLTFCNRNYVIVPWENIKTVLMQIIIFCCCSRIRTMAVVLMTFVLRPSIVDIYRV